MKFSMIFLIFGLSLFSRLLIAAESTETQNQNMYGVGNRKLGWDLDKNNLNRKKDRFLDEVQPILTENCMECHDCDEASCNTNLQSYEGVFRGWNPSPMYSLLRVRETKPSPRLNSVLSLDHLNSDEFIQAWRSEERRFYPVVAQEKEIDEADKKSSWNQSLMAQLLASSQQRNSPDKISLVELLKLGTLQADYLKTNKHQCIAADHQFKDYFTEKNPWHVLSVSQFLKQYKSAGMPFGMQSLEKDKYTTLMKWLEEGAEGPSDKARQKLNEVLANDDVQSWEKFLNKDDIKTQLMARYVYEHTYTAYITFKGQEGEYFQIVRSKNAEGDLQEILSDLPYDKPKDYDGRVYYRLKKVTHALPQKKMNVWQLSPEKLLHLQELFLGQSAGDWGKGATISFESNNPFDYFSAIPARVRNQFLQENSRLIIGAMVQGAVCIGSQATFAIDDHFWVWFLDSKIDPSVTNPSLGLELDTLNPATDIAYGKEDASRRGAKPGPLLCTTSVATPCATPPTLPSS